MPWCIWGRTGQLSSLWHPRRTQQAQVISELHERLARRFVYGELKIRFDFKIAQSQLRGSHSSSIPASSHLCPAAFLACKHGRISPRGWQAKICGWGAEGTCLGGDAQHFPQHWTLFFAGPTLQPRPFLSVAAWHIRYHGTSWKF